MDAQRLKVADKDVHAVSLHDSLWDSRGLPPGCAGGRHDGTKLRHGQHAARRVTDHGSMYSLQSTAAYISCVGVTTCGVGALCRKAYM
mmetsp:Transcript_17353/g.31280  ORF Transcript_17353/g.31280 Transcript_17353/m.31280 type:complete len:88 (+) Transcript_17353:218-481(+)